LAVRISTAYLAGSWACFSDIGSPQSKEGDERKEEKLDLILKSVNPDEAEGLINKLDEKYPRK
jgi:hypothetical protein